MWRGRPRPRLLYFYLCRLNENILATYPNPFPDFFRRKLRNSNNFSATGLSGSNGNGSARHLQKFRNEVDACVVTLAIERRCDKRKF